MDNKNFDISLIKNYINGDSLGKYSIDELENNCEFMKEVIDYTNDCNIYNLCSDNLKKDYTFVKYLVNKFNNNYEFIDKISSYYLNNGKNKMNKKELCILLENILPKELSEKYYRINTIKFYVDRLKIEMYNKKNPSTKDLVGMGFINFNKEYSNNKITFDYYVKSLIEEIMQDYNRFRVDLYDELMKSNFTSEMDVASFIVDYISKNDIFLGMYINNNLHLIDDIIKDTNKLKNQWYKEKNIINKERLWEMDALIYKYLNNTIHLLTDSSIIFYAAKELGVLDIIKEFYKIPYKEIVDDIEIDYIDLGTIDNYMDYISNKYDIEFFEEDKKVYSMVKYIMRNQLFTYNKLDIESLLHNKNKEKKLNRINLDDDNNDNNNE